MTETELKRKTWIDKAIDKRITQKAVADSLGISERQVHRLISRYRERGDIGLVSGSRGKPGNRRLKEEVAEKIKQFISQPMMTVWIPLHSCFSCKDCMAPCIFTSISFSRFKKSSGRNSPKLSMPKFTIRLKPPIRELLIACCCPKVPSLP